MYVPQMLYEVASAMDPTSVASFSTCRLKSLSRTPRSGLQESHSPGAKAAIHQIEAFGTILQETPHLHLANILRPSSEAFKRVKPLSTPTPVPLGSSYIMNRYNISSVKRDITASVYQYALRKIEEIDNAVRQLLCPSPYCRLHPRLRYRAGNPRLYIHPIEALFYFEMSLMDNSQRPIIQKSMYVVIIFTCHVA